MTITSEYGDASIELHVLELETHYYPGVNVAVSVKDNDFGGANPSVWFEDRAWDTFVLQLRKCSETRRGSASLASMSPGELELTIESSDLLGHFIVRYLVSRFRVLPSGDNVTQALSGSFSLDVSRWPQIAAQFSRFADLATLQDNSEENKGAQAEPFI